MQRSLPRTLISLGMLTAVALVAPVRPARGDIVPIGAKPKIGSRVPAFNWAHGKASASRGGPESDDANSGAFSGLLGNGLLGRRLNHFGGSAVALLGSSSGFSWGDELLASLGKNASSDESSDADFVLIYEGSPGEGPSISSILKSFNGGNGDRGNSESGNSESGGAAAGGGSVQTAAGNGSSNGGTAGVDLVSNVAPPTNDLVIANPEPTSVVLFATGMFGLGGVALRRRGKNQPG